MAGDVIFQLEQGGMSKKNSSHQIVPEVAHLINSDAAQTLVSRIFFAKRFEFSLEYFTVFLTGERHWRGECVNHNPGQLEEGCYSVA